MLSPSKKLRIMHIMSNGRKDWRGWISDALARLFPTSGLAIAVDISGTPFAQEVPA